MARKSRELSFIIQCKIYNTSLYTVELRDIFHNSKVHQQILYEIDFRVLRIICIPEKFAIIFCLVIFEISITLTMHYEDVTLHSSESLINFYQSTRVAFWKIIFFVWYLVG